MGLNVSGMDKSRPLYPSFYLGWAMLILIALIYLIKGRAGIYTGGNLVIGEEWIYLMCITAIWAVTNYSSRFHSLALSKEFGGRVLKFARIHLLVVIFILLIHAFFPFPVYLQNAIVAFVVGYFVLSFLIYFMLQDDESTSRKSDSKVKYTLVAGVGNLAGDVERSLYGSGNNRYQVKGYINCKKKEECAVAKDKVVGNLEDINDYLRDNPVDEIVIALPVKPAKKIRSIIEAADYHGIRVKYVPDYRGLFGDNYKIVKYGQVEAVNVRQLPLDGTFAFAIKNSFDKVFAFFALLFLAPVFLAIAILIKLDSPGPVLYCPVRIGKGGKPFKVYKFRSMQQNDDAIAGAKSTQKNDPRISRLGKFLRKYSLDELPQFWNVLKGEMSVVGPRPHRSYLNQQLQASEDKYMIRHYFKPGITGWAQVNGWRGPTETKEQRSQRTKHDLWYMENWSLMLDIKIVLLTIFSRKAHKTAF